MRFLEGLEVMVEAPLPGGGRLGLWLGGPAAVHLQITTGEDFDPAVSYAVVRQKWPESDARTEQTGPGAWKITTPALAIELRLEPFSLRVTDQFGMARFATAAENALSVEGPRIRLARALPENEAVYGLGEQQEALNRNPGYYRIYNRDQLPHSPHKDYYTNIPVGVCCPQDGTGPHAFFADNPAEMFVDVGLKERGRLTMETTRGDLRLWLLFEPTPEELLCEYTELTGRIERPPLWALGYHQCRYSYMSQDRVVEIAKEFRARRIPCDVIYMDIHYMDRFRSFTWNPETFSDPREMTGQLRAIGFHAVCIIDPGISIAEDNAFFAEGQEQHGFFLRHSDGTEYIARVWPGETQLPDFTNPRTRELWGRWQHTTMFENGVDGIWNDMNEPAIFAEGGGHNEAPADLVHYDHGLYRTHDRLHNIYGMTMAQASTEGQRRHRPDVRPFTITRSGWAGVQRYSSVWTGDNSASYASMKWDIQMNLSLGMSGVPFVGCDIGGFIGDTTPEMMTRWLEWGVFQPFCRMHVALNHLDHEPWSFGEATEKVARRLIGLRYQLLPYLYTLFVEAAETGMPINRPLGLQYPTDTTGVSIGDQFLLGPDILVAPVLDPGRDRRAVYLPPGDWVRHPGRESFRGGQWVLAEARFGQPPVFMRAGAVIPMSPVRQHTGEPDPEETFLDVFPAARLSGRLVEDDGATLAYTRGEESRVIFSGADNGKALNLLIGAPQGPYRSGRKRWTVRLHETQRQVTAVQCNGENVPFEAPPPTTSFTIPDNRRPLDISVAFGG